jgi:hypothetical protein
MRPAAGERMSLEVNFDLRATRTARGGPYPFLRLEFTLSLPTDYLSPPYFAPSTHSANRWP